MTTRHEEIIEELDSDLLGEFEILYTKLKSFSALSGYGEPTLHQPRPPPPSYPVSSEKSPYIPYLNEILDQAASISRSHPVDFEGTPLVNFEKYSALYDCLKPLLRYSEFYFLPSLERVTDLQARSLSVVPALLPIKARREELSPVVPVRSIGVLARQEWYVVTE